MATVGLVLVSAGRVGLATGHTNASPYPKRSEA